MDKEQYRIKLNILNIKAYQAQIAGRISMQTYNSLFALFTLEMQRSQDDVNAEKLVFNH